MASSQQNFQIDYEVISQQVADAVDISVVFFREGNKEEKIIALYLAVTNYMNFYLLSFPTKVDRALFKPEDEEVAQAYKHVLTELVDRTMWREGLNLNIEGIRTEILRQLQIQLVQQLAREAKNGYLARIIKGELNQPEHLVLALEILEDKKLNQGLIASLSPHLAAVLKQSIEHKEQAPPEHLGLALEVLRDTAVNRPLIENLMAFSGSASLFARQQLPPPDEIYHESDEEYLARIGKLAIARPLTREQLAAKRDAERAQRLLRLGNKSGQPDSRPAQNANASQAEEEEKASDSKRQRLEMIAAAKEKQRQAAEARFQALKEANERAKKPDPDNHPPLPVPSASKLAVSLKALQTVLTNKYPDENDPFHKAGKEIYQEAEILQKRFEAGKSEQDLVELAKSVDCAAAVLDNRQNKNRALALQANADNQAADKPSFWEKFTGALLVLAGLVVLSLSVAGIPFTGGASLTGMYVGGSLLTAGGAALFYHGTQGAFSKALADLATLGEAYEPPSNDNSNPSL